MDVQLMVVYEGGWEAVGSRSVDTLDWRIGLPAIMRDEDFMYTDGMNWSLASPGCKSSS